MQKEQRAIWTGTFSLVASLIGATCALLFLLFLTLVETDKNVPAAYVYTAFVLQFVVPIPLFVLFATGLILGIIGRQSWRGLAGACLAIISPVGAVLWYFYLALAH